MAGVLDLFREGALEVLGDPCAGFLLESLLLGRKM
jgi:hypothetical protein